MKSRAQQRRFVPRQICPEFRLTQEQAETVGAELIRLGAKVNGDGTPTGLSAKKIVEAASKKSSPLHRYIFGRSDSAILAAARETLARKLVNSIRIEIVLETGKREVQPIMVNLKPSPEARRGYVATETAQASPYMTDQKFAEGVNRLNGWLDEFRAFRHNDKLGPIWGGVRELLKSSNALDDFEARAEAAVPRSGQRTEKSRAA